MAGSDAVVNLIVNADGAEGTITAEIRRIVNDAERTAPTIDLRVDIDNTSVVNAINALGDRMRDVQSSTRDTDNETNRLSATFQRLGSVAGSIAPIAGRMAGIGLAAGGAVPLVGALVQSLTNIAPAAAAGVTAFVGIQAASGTLKLALSGVSDAINEVFSSKSTPEKLQKALEGLSPEARKFVGEIQKMKKGFDDLRLDTQDTLFRGLNDTLRETATAVMPQVRLTTNQMATSFNAMAKGVGTAAQGLAKDGTLGAALGSATTSMQLLERVPGQVVTAIGQIAKAGGPLLEDFARAASGVADRISKSLSGAAKSGALQNAVDRAADALRQLGRVASNIGEILGNVFGAVTSSGNGLFDTLEKITQTLADATATDAFQSALRTLSETASTLADNVLPLVSTAFQVLGPVIDALGPPVQRVLDTLGPVLNDILKQLGPVLLAAAVAVGQLLDALAPLIPIAGQLIEAILPVLTPLLEAVGRIFAALAPVVATLAQTFADTFIPAIEQLIPLITMLADFIARWVEVMAPLANEILPLVFRALFIIVPIATALLEALLPLIEGTLNFAVAIAERLVPAIVHGIEFIKSIGRAFQDLAGGAISGVIIPALQALGALLTGDFSRAASLGRQAITTMVLGIVSEVSKLPGRVQAAAAGLAAAVAGRVLEATGAAVRGMASLRDQVAVQAAKIPIAVAGRLSGLGGLLVSAGRALIGGFISGMLSRLGEVAGAAARVVGAAARFFPHSPAKEGPFSGRGWTLFSGRAVIRDFAKGIEQQTGKLRTVLSQSLALPTSSTVSGTLNASQTAGQFAATTFMRTSTPLVQVYLGNELLTDFVDTRVVINNDVRDRQASQGVRI